MSSASARRARSTASAPSGRRARGRYRLPAQSMARRRRRGDISPRTRWRGRDGCGRLRHGGDSCRRSARCGARSRRADCRPWRWRSAGRPTPRSSRAARRCARSEPRPTATWRSCRCGSPGRARRRLRGGAMAHARSRRRYRPRRRRGRAPRRSLAGGVRSVRRAWRRSDCGRPSWSGRSAVCRDGLGKGAHIGPGRRHRHAGHPDPMGA